jgi:hypothetical protein
MYFARGALGEPRPRLYKLLYKIIYTTSIVYSGSSVRIVTEVGHE